MSDPDISVVIACFEADGLLEACLKSVAESTRELKAEILVVDATGAASGKPGECFPDVIWIAAPSATLVPEMWAAGLANSKGRVVAFTTGHFEVSRPWAGALIAAIASGAVGAGGPVALKTGTGTVGKAAYFLRYSTLIPPVTAGKADFIAGDNAAYSRAALERHRDSVRKGFWEVDFHRRIFEEGEHLVIEPDAESSVGDGFRFVTLARQRFRHAVLFGAYRANETGESRLRIIVAAPLVAPVLLWRILKRAIGKGMSKPFLRSLPALSPLVCCWAVGEALGAMRRRPE